MASYEVKTINNQKVKPVKVAKPTDERPVKGGDLFPTIYGNVLFLASTNTGKTTVLYKVIEETTTKDTTCIFFVSTLYSDDVWESILEMCKNRGIPYIAHTSVMEDNVNQLELLIDHFLEKDKKAKSGEKEVEVKKVNIIQCDADEEDDEGKKKKERKCKYQAPEYLIILDDLSDEMHIPKLEALMKKSRHLKIRVICSTQYLNDMTLGSRKQLRYLCVFKGQTEDKLLELRKSCGISVDEDEFLSIYKTATVEPHSFLWIDKDKNKYRINFDKEFVLE